MSGEGSCRGLQTLLSLIRAPGLRDGFDMVDDRDGNTYLRKARETSQEPGLSGSDSRGHWRLFRGKATWGVSFTRARPSGGAQNRIQAPFFHGVEVSGAVPRARQRLAPAAVIIRTRETRDLQEPESPAGSARHPTDRTPNRPSSSGVVYTARLHFEPRSGTTQSRCCERICYTALGRILQYVVASDCRV
jgi:hypothetical protein